jgi:hypothetical protein
LQFHLGLFKSQFLFLQLEAPFLQLEALLLEGGFLFGDFFRGGVLSQARPDRAEQEEGGKKGDFASERFHQSLNRLSTSGRPFIALETARPRAVAVSDASSHQPEGRPAPNADAPT